MPGNNSGKKCAEDATGSPIASIKPWAQLHAPESASRGRRSPGPPRHVGGRDQLHEPPARQHPGNGGHGCVAGAVMHRCEFAHRHPPEIFRALAVTAGASLNARRPEAWCRRRVPSCVALPWAAGLWLAYFSAALDCFPAGCGHFIGGVAAEMRPSAQVLSRRERQNSHLHLSEYGV